MQDSHDCMFCRYRKARLAACCAAEPGSPARAEGVDPVQATPTLPPDHYDRPFPQPARQEAPHFA